MKIKQFVKFIGFVLDLTLRFIKCYFQTLGIIWPSRYLPLLGTVDVTIYTVVPSSTPVSADQPMPISAISPDDKIEA